MARICCNLIIGPESEWCISANRSGWGRGYGEDALTHEQFTDAVMDTLFVRGFVCPPRSTVAIFLGSDRQRSPITELGAVIDDMSRVPDLIRRATDPEKGTFASASGAGEEWIAVHEAAHAIVAVKAGIMVRGIRFYGDGSRGETGFEELAW